MLKKLIKFGLIALAILIVGLIVIQFFKPDRFTTNEVTQDEITNVYAVPENVQNILKRSCFDCHSNHTVWPWYSEIAPISWLVADDVKKGRNKMNFSEWKKLSASKQSTKLQNICDMITDDEMPLPKYLLIHKNAVLTKEDKDILCKWADAQADSLDK